ncbi:hypothetical protein DXM27_05110 [Rhizobium rhizogenes]|uniref:Uncharacterized protein n=1 Tax=Rhizobium rhizogenes TaxID=359 RepID=A0AA88JU71_RHIRH|nr:hypothetical protein [Rhizobium rhizogenes]KAA3504594.1 hypothetical protein DXM27_05110 [Rhizobium rhizogenes]
MAEVDTSFYPKANPNALLDTLSTVATVKNLGEQNKLLQLQQTRQGIDTEQARVNLAHQQFGILSQTLGSLAQDPRIATADGPGILQSTTQQLIKQGILSPEMANEEMGAIPANPADIPQYLQNLNVRVQSAADQFSKVYGSPTMVDNGSSITPATVSPITGVRAIGAPIQHTLGPAQRGELVQTTDNQGRTVLVPKGQILEQAGVNPLTATPEAAPQGNMLAPPPQPVERGNLAPVQQEQPRSSIGVVTSPAAGQIEAQSRTAQASADRYSDDTARERTYQQEVLPLEKALPALEALGTTGTGPGTEQLQEMKSFLTSMGIMNPSEELKNYDEARKYLVQYARGAGDTGTNDKLAAAFAGNPSLGISNAAAVDVVKTALSLRRMQNGQVRAFTQTGLPESSYTKWSTEWNAQNDPVAYGFDLMKPSDRAKYFSKLSEADKKKFLSSLQTATSLGLVAPPSVNNGSESGK